MSRSVRKVDPCLRRNDTEFLGVKGLGPVAKLRDDAVCDVNPRGVSIFISLFTPWSKARWQNGRLF